MRPSDLHTKIFLDGGDSKETERIIERLGFLDGQTTNPTLIAKHPSAQARLGSGRRFQREEAAEFYRGVVQEIGRLIPQGSVSVEVYADRATSAEDMLRQAGELSRWIPNAHVKIPITAAGLRAAIQALKQGIRLNMTLCFSQAQAAAVYAATRGAPRGSVFLSPFVGRLDDRGEDGMSLAANIIRMFRQGDGHVEVLTASVRNLNHLLCAITLGSDIVTAPAQVLEEWAQNGMMGPTISCMASGLRRIPYDETLSLSQPWESFELRHDLTDAGIDRFATDWNALIEPSRAD